VDAAVAIKAYEKAVSGRSTHALLRLGNIYRYGRFVRANGKRAAKYYRQAADAGNAYGLYGLGTMYAEREFRGIGSPAKGLEFLRGAEAAGVPEAVVAISNSYLYGRGVKRSPKQALARLITAMNNGNLTAARELISIHRSGRQDHGTKLLPRNQSLARTYLEQIASRLGLGDLAFENLLFESSRVKGVSKYHRLYDRLQDLPPGNKSAFIRELRTLNPTAYLFLIQTRLKQLGHYRGKVTGQFNSATSRAVRKYCDRIKTRYFCREGPMTGQTAEILSYAFVSNSMATQKIQSEGVPVVSLKAEKTPTPARANKKKSKRQAPHLVKNQRQPALQALGSKAKRPPRQSPKIEVTAEKQAAPVVKQSAAPDKKDQESVGTCGSSRPRAYVAGRMNFCDYW
jgi:uncharacterized protein